MLEGSPTGTGLLAAGVWRSREPTATGGAARSAGAWALTSMQRAMLHIPQCARVLPSSAPPPTALAIEHAGSAPLPTSSSSLLAPLSGAGARGGRRPGKDLTRLEDADFELLATA